MIEARAPGKLVITGEYAVLHGAPAITMAVDVWARARVKTAAASANVFIDRRTGERYSFEFYEKNHLIWTEQQPGQRVAVVQAVFDALSPILLRVGDVPPMEIELDTDDFFRACRAGDRKLGLGSSAAVLVALVGATAAYLGLDMDRTEMGRTACIAHNAMQGGRGSGIDVLTALSGGVGVAYSVAANANPAIELLAWPEGLRILPVWSGTSASTPELLGRFDAYRDDDPVQFNNHISKLGRIAAQTVSVWRAGDVSGVLRQAEQYAEALLALDGDGGIGIDTDSHRQLREMITRHGAVYKTSGAGGGDFGLVMSDSAEVIQTIRADLIAQDKFLLDAPMVSRGLTIKHD